MNRFRQVKGKALSVYGVLLVAGFTCLLLVLSSLSAVSAQGGVVRPTKTPTTTPTPHPPSGIPLCPDELHDPNEWHSLMNTTHNCHYDHEHKHDPNEVADIFGPAGEWFGGTSLSYPWETDHENMHKHEAYSWIVRRDIPANDRLIWIKDFRWQIHAISAPFTHPDTGELHGGYLGRYHSHSLEAQVCNYLGQCGIVRTAGWIDFGHLEINKIDNCVDLPSDPSQQDTCPNLGRRRIHYFYQGNKPVPNTSTFFWYGRAGALNGPLPALHPVQVAVATSDGSVNLVPDDLYTLHFFCPNWDCHLNNTTIQAHLVSFVVPRKYDPDDDGLANYIGYADRYGVEVEGCTEVSLDCIPLIIDGAPHGEVDHKDVSDLGLTMGNLPEFDLSPPGEWWIRYPGSPALPPVDDDDPPNETPEPPVDPPPPTVTPRPTRVLPVVQPPESNIIMPHHDHGTD